MVADALKSDGWEVRFLGTDVAVPDVLEAISSTPPGGPRRLVHDVLQNLSKVSFLVGTVKATFGEACTHRRRNSAPRRGGRRNRRRRLGSSLRSTISVVSSLSETA